MEAKQRLDRWERECDQASPIRVKDLSRGGLINWFHKFGFKIGAEIGVDTGRFSKVILDNIKGVKLYLVDSWAQGNYKRTGDDRCEQTLFRLKAFKEQITIIKNISTEAVKQVKDESLDFVYIDGDHTFDYVVTDIIEWAKKVKKGGIISGHDYYHFRDAGVIEAVDAYAKMHRVKSVFITDYLKDRTPSWFFIKTW